jgi:two-component system, LuxR family, response regulator FixJ
MTAAAEFVGIVDDDLSVRRGLRRLFKSAGYAAETFASAEDYLAREIFDGPTCLVLDVRMPGLNGLGLQETLQSRGGCEEIVFITGHSDVPTCTQAMKKGAVDFLLKPFDDGELIGAVARALVRGRECLRRRAERRDARGRIDKLTPREFEVLRFVIMGLLNKQIAAELETAEKTIKVHRGRVMQKLGLTSVADLVRFSQNAGVSPAKSSMGLRSTIGPDGTA